MKQKICLMAMLWPIIYLIFMCAVARAQDPAPGSALTGVVVDTAGHPIAGATITIRGTTVKTQTNANGRFSLKLPESEGILVVSYLGHQPVTETITPNNIGPFHFVLYPEENTLQEVEINAGYWTVRDDLRTGNISRVDGAIIRQQPVSNPMLALAGRVPGLQVSQNSGLPGASHSMRIRGSNSLANGTTPLYLVDGVPFSSGTLTNSVIGGGATSLSPFMLLNAQEIESIEVLKDADATAIYGSRGANGVVLITTKKGKVGNTQINLNAYTGFGKAPRKIDLLNTEQYLEMRREAFANDGITTYPASAYDVNGSWDQDRYTDWQKVIIGNTSTISNVQAQISGGAAQTQFTFGAGLLRETTVFPGDYRTMSGSANINLNHRSTNDKFGLSISARYLNNNNDQPQMDFTVNNIFIAPNAPAIYDDEGNLNWENESWNNPFAQLYQRAKATSKNLISNGTLDYQVLDELQLKVNFGYTEQTMNQSNITPITTYRPSIHYISDLRTHLMATNERRGWIVEPQVNYNKRISLGELAFTLGGTLQENKSYTLAYFASDFADDALIENIMAAGQIRTQENRQTQYRYVALFGRINYNWQDKYVLNVVARRDGSTRFAPGRRYGNFASVGGAWIFSNEELFKNSALSLGKLRASYGITGNDQMGDYQYLSTYSTYAFPYLGVTGLYPTRLYATDYGWEAVRKIETALDLGFWGDRVKLSTSYFRNRTDNQLVGYPLPTMTGFPSIRGNLPAVIESKGWEFELNTSNIANTNFSWNTAFNLSIPNSKLIAYPDFENSSYRNSLEIGKPLSIQRLYHWTGVDPETGIHTYEDVDGDENISSPQDLRGLVNTAQRYYGGITNSISYKGLSLDIFFHFVKKQGRLPIRGVPGTFTNQLNRVLDRWQQPGDITDIQRFTQSGIALTTMVNGLNNGDLVYGDASYIRLKNLALSYQLPTKFAPAAWLKNCRLYVQCQNLFTFTNYLGLDPETESSLPAIRMISTGINLTL